MRNEIHRRSVAGVARPPPAVISRGERRKESRRRPGPLLPIAEGVLNSERSGKAEDREVSGRQFSGSEVVKCSRRRQATKGSNLPLSEQSPDDELRRSYARKREISVMVELDSEVSEDPIYESTSLHAVSDAKSATISNFVSDQDSSLQMSEDLNEMAAIYESTSLHAISDAKSATISNFVSDQDSSLQMSEDLNEMAAIYEFTSLHAVSDAKSATISNFVSDQGSSLQMSDGLDEMAAIYESMSLHAVSDAKSATISRFVSDQGSSSYGVDRDWEILRSVRVAYDSTREMQMSKVYEDIESPTLKILKFLKYCGDGIIWALQNLVELFYIGWTVNRSSFPCYTAANSSSQYSQKSFEDLPDDIIVLILEDLPLPDYLSFASVCHQWMEIQRAHRDCIPTFRPRIVPWLVPNLHSITPCYSNFQNGRIYHLQIPEAVKGKQRLFSSDGWLLLLGHPVRAWARGSYWEVTLFNPVTQQIIRIPNLTYDERQPFLHGCMSPDPMAQGFAVIIVTVESVYLWRQGDLEWILLHVYSQTLITSVFSKVNQVFYLKPFIGGDLYVIDPMIPEPILDRIIMGDCTDSPPHREAQFLVEIEDQICLVETCRGVGCRIFRAGIVEGSWDRMLSVGSVTLFMSRSASFSLPHSCARSRPNSIYLPKQIVFGPWFSRSEVDQNIVYMSHSLSTMGRRTSFLPGTTSGADRIIFLKSDLLWLLPTISNEE